MQTKGSTQAQDSFETDCRANLGEDVCGLFWFANDVLQCFANEFPFCSFSPDTSGVVFDTRSKMVMSQGGTADRMKEKVRLSHSTESLSSHSQEWRLFNTPSKGALLAVSVDALLSSHIQFH